MAHINSTLPIQIELGAVRRERWGTEIVTTDGGHEVRNNRWATPLRTYDVSFPPAVRTDPVYLSVIELYAEAEGSLHSFDFTDWTDETGGTVVKVRFDTPLEIVGLATHLDQIENMTLVEVRQ
jgi:uncharacterized protein (TIGR02217 family)